MIRKAFRELLLGRKEFILSRTEYKRALLTSQLCLVTFFLCAIYFLIDQYNHVYHSWILQCGCAILSIICLILNRARYFTTAKILLAIGINITVFSFSQVEPQEVGLYMFYIPTSLGALAAFGYEERWKGIILIFLPLALFSISQNSNFTFIEKDFHREDLDQLNLIINFGGALLASVMIIYFLISTNYQSEASMIEHEKEVTKKNFELIRVNTELDQFVYSTSHDLMAPLSSVKGLINLTRFTNDPDEIKHYLTMMDERVENLQKFIRDISDYSRNSRIEIVKSPVSVYKVVQSILENLQFYPNAVKIDVTLEIPTDLEIVSDLNRMQIILSNLITNSFKYADLSKDNSFLKISTALLDNHIEIKIEDNGLGIKEEYQHAIFDMFFQATEKSEGSGLGLYIVKQAIEKLNGTIQVSSKYRMGTSFLVYLPLH
ncbi:MAG: HAMP domain-containing histidine kinase [Cyclobacteriaceae bacterium]|nr:HAMP domain-containing histidine kinase [Cyclobacteriaceae bacterium]